MSRPARLSYIESEGLVHPHPEAVRASAFWQDNAFFLAADKLQVKYEMLRAHFVDGASVVAAAADHGYSRPSFYAAADGFARQGMTGLLDDRPGRRGPLRLTDEVATFSREAPGPVSGAELAGLVETRFGVSLHRRTVEKARKS
ncbi:MAG: helix-turn-helix domain-containing protein [Acidimicrobiales bacterium]